MTYSLIAPAARITESKAPTDHIHTDEIISSGGDRAAVDGGLPLGGVTLDTSEIFSEIGEVDGLGGGEGGSGGGGLSFCHHSSGGGIVNKFGGDGGDGMI